LIHYRSGRSCVIIETAYVCSLMRKLIFIPFSLILFIGLISVISDTGCANIMPPQGGYKDTIPPLLLKATPGDSSKNFDANHITLTFDEFINLDNPHENLLISPVPKIEPVVEAKLRTVIIRLKDTLEPNTTYTLNFGNAIKDVNEGNPAKNFTYIFSTGSTFDSLSLSGKVILAETGRVDSTLAVILHKNGDDSAVVNEKPRYATHLDSSGNFTFRNLPPGTFYVYALKNEGGSYRYLSERQLFAFADSPVVLSGNNEPITLYAYTEKASIEKTATTTPTLTPQIGGRQRGATGARENRLRLQTNLDNGQLDLLNNLTVTSDLPLRKLDTSLLHFSRDSSFTPITDYTILRDTSGKKLTFQYNWTENTLYHVIAEKDFAEDTLGKKLLKADTINFKTKKLSQYGSLTLRFKNLDLSANPVLLFVQNDNVVKSVPLNSARIDLPIVLPGDYQLRILNDRNKNGKWDSGQFFGKHIQPEIVKSISRHINVKADWNNDFDISAPSGSPNGGEPNARGSHL
jgi:Bacterial Ig-like domain